MKNSKYLSLALAALMLVQGLGLPAKAAEIPQASTFPTETEFQEVTVAPPVLTFGTVGIYNGCRGIESQIPVSNDAQIVDTAQSIMIYERNTGSLIYAKNPDIKLSPGTLTKMVTALIVIENCPLDAIVTCSSRNISKLPPGTQHVDLKEGEQLTVNDLLHCLILESANDAAIALAEHVSGNQEAFVELMNARVQQMGCYNTRFSNVHGLDNKPQQTTARDMTRFMLEATKNVTFRKLLSEIKYKVPATNRSEERAFRTGNYLIDEFNISKYYDTRVTGGMGAYSEVSGASLVCTAEYGGMDIVCVLLNSERRMMPNGWQVEYYGNFDEMTELVEYTFSSFRVKRIVYDGQALSQFSVIDGENNVVGEPHVNIDTVLPNGVNMSNLIITTNPTDGGLTAPIKKGDMISTVEIWYRTCCLAEAELFAMSDVRVDKDSGIRFQGEAARGDDDTSGFLGFVKIVSAIILIPVALYLVVNTIRRHRAMARKRRRRSGRRRSR